MTSAGSVSNRREHGLTLIELLIAITITGMMMAVLLQSFQLASRAWNDRSLSDDGVTETAITRDWIRRELRQAQPMMITAEDDSRALAFEGESEAVTFVATLPAHLGGGGLYWIELRIIEAGSGRQLAVETELFHPDVARSSSKDSRILIESIESARFEYYGSVARDEPPSWHDSWTEMDYLPSLVRLTIEGTGENSGAWPAMVGALMIDGARPAEHRSFAGTVTRPDG